MKLAKATISGVGHFAKEQGFEFSLSDEEPITVLHGENGAGKTSTLNAILWCLTGQLSPAWTSKHSGEIDGFINSSFKDSSAVPFVEVEFFFKEERYRAIRKASGGSLEGEFSLKRLSGGTWDSFTKSSTAVMTNILPPGIARYFIFDGEGFQQSKSGDRSVINSVKTILGFDHIETAIELLQESLEERSKSLNKLESSRISDERKRNAYERASNELEQLKKNKSDLLSEKEVRKTELSEAQSRIQELNIARVNALRREREEKEALDRRMQVETKQLQRDRLNLVSKYYRPVFGRSLLDEGLSVIEDNREKGVIPGNYSRQFIQDLKESGQCICGRSIGEEEETVLDSKIDKGFTNALQQRLEAAGACSKDDSDILQQFKREYGQINAGLTDLHKARKENTRRIDELSQQLQELGNHEERLEELQNWEARIKADLLRIEEELTACEDGLERAATVRKTFRPAADRDDEREVVLSRQIACLEELLAFARAFLEEEFHSAHSMIQSEMNSFLSRTNIPYGASLDDAFGFRLCDASGNTGYGSTGELKTLEYAFLCSLVNVLKKKSESTGGLLSSGSRIPLVLDAPFSELAETYVKYISDMLLSVSDQLTVLMFNKDWKDFESVCADQIGKEYVLVKNITDSNENRTEEVLEFGGVSVACVRYNADVDHTTLTILQ